MLTKNEITALNLSPTKKDFVQIWNELLEVAGRLSERWDPTSTNESDPGIVILKALTGIADKLNYNIDKNTLEAFMPTAAQEDSMRKLCDMLGYNVKYYRSAETTVTVKYFNSEPSAEEEEVMSVPTLLIPKFTTITNGDQDINYFTTNRTPYYISSAAPTIGPIPCMEGQIVKCESATGNNVITISQITENNRFYLPEYKIAENGIFVYNVAVNQEDGDQWEKVDNLNVQARGSRVFKFGYDSYEGRPYIEFPEDYSGLINDGLFIYYARTSGASGNISARTLTQLELPGLTGWDKVSAESFSVENAFSATTGANIETINQAYNSFKKTVGTFETLVTCRDYMNKIYAMTDEDTHKNLVSNILATDMRTDLNRAITICSCDDAGIFYKEAPLVVSTATTENIVESPLEEGELEVVSETFVASDANKPIYSVTPGHHQYGDVLSGRGIIRYAYWKIGNLPIFNDDYSRDFVANTAFKDSLGGTVSAYNADGSRSNYWLIEQDGTTYTTKLPIDWVTSTIERQINTVQTKIVTQQETETAAISHFDLVLYPFKSYSQIKSNVKDIQKAYDKSFEYNPNGFSTIKNKLDQSAIKTIAHSIVSPREHDIISINNYLRLNAIIGTTSKVTTEESSLLIDKIKIALANAFNMRELDFGEEIPFDSILSVIENADPRISVVSLAEPALYTTFSVYEGKDTANNPILREYAVASDWLTESSASSTSRFDYKVEEGTTSKYLHTFDVEEAKKIYNRLAVRNVLAGRVPLFKYNTTFKNSFSEGAYRVTKPITENEKPTKLQEPTEVNPFTIYTENGVVYTGQWATDGINYSKTYTPPEYSGNIITKSTDEDSNITKIVPSCIVKSDIDTSTNTPSYKVSNVTLVDGEYVKFRAPNFTTNRTYPAYVNYRLDLGTDTLSEGVYATAYTLNELLNTADNGQTSVIDRRRQAVLDYFAQAGRKKTFTLAKKIVNTPNGPSGDTENDFIINIENISTAGASLETFDSILAKSSFAKLVEPKATLAWDTSDEQTDPTEDFPIEAPELILGNSLFITNASVLERIKDAVDNYLADNAEAIAGITGAWTISFTFEYAPFEQATLATWSSFITTKGWELFGFHPVVESGNVIWRTYDGGYPAGKYILEDTLQKLMPFTNTHFGLIEALVPRTAGIYIVKDLGQDVKANFISNNEEYKLKAGEYLYIEYTPSTTTEDGATQTQEPIQEILGNGDGTIIKPSGFDLGLMDSTAYEAAGNSAHKTVTFGTTNIAMHSLGANEQIAIRELSRVTLDSKVFSTSPTVYVYKNFNNCDALEKVTYANGKRINNSYTLKDGEYIFYTDQNKTEFAYFSSGTEITLTGKVVLSKRDIIDLAMVFDNGIDEIPWELKTFSGDDSILFQEFQYITLGPKDTLNNLRLTGSEDRLSAVWQACDEVTYTPAGSEQPMSLPKINVSDSATAGNGWEASSVLILSSSPNSEQTLRNTEQVETSVTLYTTPARGVGTPGEIVLKAEDAEHPISFKTNLACQSNGSELELEDIYVNPNAIESLEVKVFAEQPPAILKTQQDRLVPAIGSSITDITKWSADTEKAFSAKGYGELWTRVPLTYLTKTTDTDETIDYALRLPVTVLPNTYGIFSIYVNYAIDYTSTVTDLTTNTDSVKTWIDLLPGTSHNDITLLNVPENEITWISSPNNYERLMLRAGVNCIRVNRTCDLFIKTDSSPSTTSAIYFDDIRLVDCLPVEYTENGELKSQKTQGLNLTQIGYLDVTQADPFSTFDMQIRRKLREEYTETTLATLDTREQVEDETLGSSLNRLQAYKDRLQKLVNFLATAGNELSLHENKSEEDLTALFSTYAELREDLEQEKNLKTALEGNQGINALEQQLKALLESISSAEAIKQELLSQLDNLEEAASNNASVFTQQALSKGAILDDFDSAADLEDSQLLADLKLFSTREVNKRYASQLATLKDQVTSISDASAQKNLLSVLEDINLVKSAKLTSQIQALLGVNQDALEALLETAQQQATGTLNTETALYEVNYTTLRATLIRIREQLTVAGVKDLLLELSQVFDSSLVNTDRYDALIKISEDLTVLLDTEATSVYGNYTSLINNIEDVLTAIQTKLSTNSTAYDTTIATNVSALSHELRRVYLSQLATLLADLQSTLTDIEAEYSASVEQLRNQLTEEAAQSIFSSLDAYNTERRRQIDQIESLVVDNKTANNEIYDELLPFGIQTVVTVWPAYMNRDYALGVAALYNSLRNAIYNPAEVDALIIDENFYTKSEPKALRQVLANAANLAAFQQLFDLAKGQAIENTQNTRRIYLINSLGSLITPSSELSAALQSVISDSDHYANRNALLQSLATRWLNASTIAEKQRLVNELTQELTSVIEIDTQLVDICAGILCPSILRFSTHTEIIADEPFYARLRSYIEACAEELLQTTDGFADRLKAIHRYLTNAYVVNASLYAALVADTISQFTYFGDIIVTDESSTLLPKFYLEELLAAKTALSIKQEILHIRASSLLSFLQKTPLVVAWEEKTQSGAYNWLDSYGHYYQKFTSYKTPLQATWVAYPEKGSAEEQEAWLNALGDWTDSRGYWRNATGESVLIDAKRYYENATWYDRTNTELLKTMLSADSAWLRTDGDVFTVLDSDLAKILDNLFENLSQLGQLNYMNEETKAAHNILLLETQLLNEIRELDKNREFYYNVPVETNLAIDFNDSETKLNTLMNPAVNYDINNINNNFVISKIDIGYLDSGLQIARSSKLT
jgi:hypothetical protein